MADVVGSGDRASGAHPFSQGAVFLAIVILPPRLLANRKHELSVVLHPQIGNPSNGGFDATRR